MHDLLKPIVGGNYYGPVKEVLAEHPSRVKSAGTPNNTFDPIIPLADYGLSGLGMRFGQVV
jgi:hypothetical protein